MDELAASLATILEVLRCPSDCAPLVAHRLTWDGARRPSRQEGVHLNEEVIA